MRRLALLALVMMALPACNKGVPGSGTIVTRTKALPDDTDQVRVCCGWHVTVKPGDVRQVTLTGDDNVVDSIIVTDDGRNAIISHTDRTSYAPSKPVEVVITLPKLTAIAASGGAKVDAGPLGGTGMAIEASGGAQITAGPITGGRLEVELSGGARVTTRGQIAEVDIDASAGAIYDGGGLSSAKGEVKATGGAKSTVDARSALEINASGGAQVFYKGSPRLQKNTSGGALAQQI